MAVGATAGAGGVLPIPERKETKHKPTPDKNTKNAIVKHKGPEAKDKTVTLAKDEVPTQRSKDIALLKESPPTQQAIKEYPKYFSLSRY